MTSRTRALLLTARPKTLAAAIVPVMVATALVKAEGLTVTPSISVFAVLSAIMIQIGTNFINDALDFWKGADKETRLGDARACQSGWFSPRTVLLMGLGCFATAMLLGLPLVYVGGWPIFWVGIASLLMGYAYTGGPYPLAYVGLGDLFVILFFGLVAVGGVYYLQTAGLSAGALVAGLQVGLLATVLIAINNLRDLDQDREVNKRTLAVRLGPKLGRLEVLLLILVAFVLNLYWLGQGAWLAFLLPLFALPPAIKVVLTLLRSQASREYNRLLAKAAFVHMLFGVLLSIGFVLR
ncbi:MAG: 1,4-dihydroxy-2-naphthoate polyprenyltransferase [Bdellovibrionales bacterium]|nr:1,4-dihydroxy-2-naphthoate polyprenyltransferase [Bdellovibrionales bacterium]